MIRKSTTQYRHESSSYARRDSTYTHRRRALMRPAVSLPLAPLPIAVAQPAPVSDPLLAMLPPKQPTPSITKRVSSRLPTENQHSAL